MGNIVIGIVLQCSLVALAVFLLIGNCGAAAGIAAVAAAILNNTWYHILRNWPEQQMALERERQVVAVGAARGA